MPKHVKIYLSRPKGLKVGNFGDEITLPILQELLGVEGVPVPMHDADMIATGSILDAYARARPLRRLVTRVMWRTSELAVWGSGFMLPDTAASWPAPLRVMAVRGHETARRLDRFTGAFGDPGILASLLKLGRGEASAVCIVPHFVDAEVVDRLDLPSHWKVAHTDQDVSSVLSAIKSADLVISSSLHGLIVADAFGVPAVWARSQNPLHRGSLFKFSDHASARGKPFNDPISYEEAIRLDSRALSQLATVAARDISSWQDDILKSFSA